MVNCLDGVGGGVCGVYELVSGGWRLFLWVVDDGVNYTYCNVYNRVGQFLKADFLQRLRAGFRRLAVIFIGL